MKKHKKLKIFLIILISIFTILGIIFSSIVIHEFVHILQADDLKSICWDFNKEEIAHVDFSVNGTKAEEYKKTEKLFNIEMPSFEKTAYITQFSYLIVFSFLLGLLIALVYKEFKK